MKIVAVIQTRMNSTRLPGKATLDIGGMPVLWHIYRRLMMVPSLDQVVVSIGMENCNSIKNLCREYGMHFWVGPEMDLIKRHYGAGMEHKADAILRVTADEPFICPGTVGILANNFSIYWPEFEFMCNWAPRTWPDGNDCDIISMRLLSEISKIEECPKEDYSTWVMKNKSYCPLKNYTDASQVNVCLDTPEDYEKLKYIHQECSKGLQFSWEEVCMKAQEYDLLQIKKL